MKYTLIPPENMFPGDPWNSLWIPALKSFSLTPTAVSLKTKFQTHEPWISKQIQTIVTGDTDDRRLKDRRRKLAVYFTCSLSFRTCFASSSAPLYMT